MFIWKTLREDSQIHLSIHNVKWTLSPDPHPTIMSMDKNQFFGKVGPKLRPQPLMEDGMFQSASNIENGMYYMYKLSFTRYKIGSIKFNSFQLIAN